jgi:hypothetical protein
MTKWTERAFIALAILLPWHGFITVFFPELFRFWKEGLLVFLGLAAIAAEAGNGNLGSLVTGRRLFVKKISAAAQHMTCVSPPEVWAWVFFAWGTLLAFSQTDLTMGLTAWRYLGMGFLWFLILLRLRRYGQILDPDWSKKVFHKFSTAFIFSNLVAVLFGIWAKFGGGFAFLKNFYSQTISSWVPGQTIPLYHEADDLIRLQGTSSGPIEFSHLLVVALFLAIISPLKKQNLTAINCKLLTVILLLFGIWQSGSRAAGLAALIILGYWFYTVLKSTQIWKKHQKIGRHLSLFLIITGSLLLTTQTSLWQRAGTSDHFTRPVEAFQIGLQAPLWGQLGQLGPAARAKNLKENNNDQAPIAENVFVDYFAQLGLLGLILALGFFVSLFRQSEAPYRWFIGVALILMNLATIFDMTPIALSFFTLFAFSVKSDTIALKKSI